MPTSAQAFFLLRTYVAESPLLPTSTTARPGACAYRLASTRPCEVKLYGQWQSKVVRPSSCMLLPHPFLHCSRLKIGSSQSKINSFCCITEEDLIRQVRQGCGLPSHTST